LTSRGNQKKFGGKSLLVSRREAEQNSREHLQRIQFKVQQLKPIHSSKDQGLGTVLAMIRSVQLLGLTVPKFALQLGTPAAQKPLNTRTLNTFLRTTPRNNLHSFNKFSLSPRVGMATGLRTPSPTMSYGSSIFASCLHLGMYPHVLGSSNSAAIRIYSSQPPKSPRNRLVSGLGMVGAGGMLLLGKGKYLIGALKLTKFASLGSMLLTVGAYTAFCECRTFTSYTW